MKNLISYVIQDSQGHNHMSEIIHTTCPISYSPEPDMSSVIKWRDKKQKELGKEKKLIIVNVFKL